MSDGDGPVRGLSNPTVEITPSNAPRRASEPEVSRTSTPPGASPFDHREARFEHRGELGRGGMGRVEDAFDRALDRPVAIKHVLRGSDLDLTRFEREVRITARLEHPGIVPVHDAGRDDDGTPYYVMRRVDGQPLDQVMAGAPLAERLALIPNVLAACDAMAYAHARGVVHRDLKPTNILIGRFGETLVIDWGLAREVDPDAAKSGVAMAVVDDAKTAAGAIAGTPGFMAPEQARGEVVDVRADVFALGATLFYLVAGRSPYPGANATEMIVRAGERMPADWAAWPRGVPTDLRAIVAKALATDADARYADAGALASDLRRYVTGKLVDAHRYGAAARLVRFARRHRAAVAVSAVSALALAVVATVLVRRIVDERDRASDAAALAEQRQREATDVADQMLVERARSLAESDPPAAIALLRRLSPESTRWREAWMAATRARRRGIPIGFRAAPRLQWLELSGDGARAVATAAAGEVQVFDLVARTARTVATLDRVGSCHWIGATTLACVIGSDALRLVDTTTGAVRPVGVQVDSIQCDRRSRAIVATPDHRVVEVHADGTTREVASGVQLAIATDDLGELVWWRGGDLELWTAAATRTIAHVGTASHHQLASIAILGDWIAGIVGNDVVRWHVAGDRVVEAGRWPVTGVVQLAVVGEHVYARTIEGVRALDAPIVAVDAQPAQLQQTARGFVAIEQAGTIALFDGSPTVRLGPSPVQLVRIDVSPDGRVVAALTAIDELLVWDADTVRPRPRRIDNDEQLLRMTGDTLWTLEFARGLVRRGLTAGTKDLAIPMQVSIAQPWIAIASDGSWAALREMPTGPLVAYDTRAREPGKMPASVAETLDQSTDTLVVATKDGHFGRWRSGDTEITQVGTAPAGLAATGLAAAGSYVLELAGERDVARVELPATARGRATMTPAVTDGMVMPDGRAWLVTAGGAAWRWDVGAPAPVRLDLLEPVDQLVGFSGHIVARSPHAITVLDASPPRAIAIESQRTADLGGGYLAAAASTGAVSLVDLDTAVAIPLGVSCDDAGVVASGDRVIYQVMTTADDRRLGELRLDVPRDPAALRAWLSTVTNAREAASGGGVAWP